MLQQTQGIREQVELRSPTGGGWHTAVHPSGLCAFSRLELSCARVYTTVRWPCCSVQALVTWPRSSFPSGGLAYELRASQPLPTNATGTTPTVVTLKMPSDTVEVPRAGWGVAGLQHGQNRPWMGPTELGDQQVFCHYT